MQNITKPEPVNLTEFTKGGGCGCKIPPSALAEIIGDQTSSTEFGLLVGNSGGDDAAVWKLDEENCIVSTTDFFTPIVDDPYDFGRIAAANSISDVYAMGGRPIMALSILAWPTEKLSSSIAAEVLRGARTVCAEAGISIGGGHSIENPEPVFGLAVTGLVSEKRVKKNNSVKVGDVLILTKPLGSGILSTAMKRKMLSDSEIANFVTELVKLNSIGEKLSLIHGVNAMTDVTGFGLIGHLIEMTRTQELSALVNYKNVPLLDGVRELAAQFVYADNTMRNWKAFNELVEGVVGESLLTLCDPQTNGGLLISVEKGQLEEVKKLLNDNDQFFAEIGEIVPRMEKQIVIK